MTERMGAANTRYGRLTVRPSCRAQIVRMKPRATGELGPHEEPRLDRANRRFEKSRSVFEGPGNISRPVFSGAREKPG